MVSAKTFTFIAAALASLLSVASAAPTGTTVDKVVRDGTGTYNAPGATHSVVVGRGGLLFDPENIVAEPGDIVEFHFTPRNHSVVQSNFANPCQPIEGGFFSGFFPTQYSQNPEVFQITIKDRNPIWFYCSQTNGDHCQNGMSGAINQDFSNNEVNLRGYKAKAAAIGGVSGTPVVPYSENYQIFLAGNNNGVRIRNPNPYSGF